MSSFSVSSSVSGRYGGGLRFFTVVSVVAAGSAVGVISGSSSPDSKSYW